MRRIFIPVVILFSIFCFPLSGEEFVYKFASGNKYRIVSSVSEDVYIDSVLSHHAEILNRIAVTVESVENGRARHRAVFDTAEKADAVKSGGGGIKDGTGGSFTWAREYESIFEKDSTGVFTIDKQYFMPVVRNVPVFPRKNLSPGETWKFQGHEVHDFRDSFGITEPYYIPFTADYSFLGYREWKGKEYPAVSVRYLIDERPPKAAGLLWPLRIRGASDQVVYWDPELGQTRSYTETFSVLFELSNGRVIEYRGQAEAELQKVESMEKSSLARAVAEAIEESKVADTSVRVTDEGVVIALENIQFSPDSAVLRPSEREKLNRIGEILNRYPDRDILVGGHTALAGTAEGREQLSRERAAEAADYLIRNGVRTADRVIVQGYGAGKPLAGNTTEAGRRRNRRVEITILEN